MTFALAYSRPEASRQVIYVAGLFGGLQHRAGKRDRGSSRQFFGHLDNVR
jgi:hypothetical protein